MRKSSIRVARDLSKHDRRTRESRHDHHQLPRIAAILLVCGASLLAISQSVAETLQLTAKYDSGRQLARLIVSVPENGAAAQGSVNQAPVVNAGTDQTVTLPSNANLSGSVTDDGLPRRSKVTSTWSKQRGPGTVTFAKATSPSTTASFSKAGTYVLRLTATDTALSAFDDVTITVNTAPKNTAPVVDAGADQTITLPSTAALAGRVTDDGLPAGAALTSTWSKANGPGVVTFANASSPSTTASFSLPGTYTLRLTATDTDRSASDQMTVIVNPLVVNTAPVVSAGSNQAITLPGTANLSGSVADDGLPAGSIITSTWSKTSGPGIVTFADVSNPVTTAAFDQAGSYVLRLTASDTDKSSFAEVAVTVNPPPTPTINATAAPAANAAGWNNTDVTVSFTCTNATTCPSPILVTTEGASQTITGTATGPGGSTDASVVLNIDKTAPVVQITSPADLSSTTSSPIAVQGNFSAGGSPIGSVLCNSVAASISGTNFSCSVTLQNGSNQIAATATDVAGNTGSATISVTLQTTAPTITAASSPLPNAAGWNNSDVTVSFTCANATTCPSPILVTTEGASQTITGTATGPGGSTDASVVLNIDKTAPVVQITAPADLSTVTSSPIAVTGNVSAGGSPIASVLCNAVAASITGTNFSCSVALQNGPNQIAAAATDAAGNTGSATISVTLQTTGAPTITAAASPLANAAGWNNTDVTVTFTCGNATTCPSPIVVTTEGANQTISGTAIGAGGSTSASVTLNIDKTAPAVQITSPANNAFVSASPVQVQGSFTGGGSPIATVTCFGSLVTPSGTSFSCTASLLVGPNQITASVTDAAGNLGSAAVNVTFSTTTTHGPAIQFNQPATLAVFNAQQTPITASGTVDDPAATVIVTSPDASNGVQAGVSGGTWTAQGIPLREGHNLLTATATNAQGGVSSATLTVTLDTVPPIIRINSPPSSAVLTSGQIAVSGVVNDIVPGTVNAEEVSVQINGLDAQVSNRTFIVPQLLLAHGVNTLTAVATDRAGNQSTNQIQVTLQDDVLQQRIQLVSGDQQSAPIGSTLPAPLVARLVDSQGAAVANRAVTFQVVKSDGTLASGDQQVQELAVTTDDQGNASSTFTLGKHSGVGNHQIVATAPGFAGSAIFSESATIGVPAQINVVSGNDQRGPVGQPLSLPYVVVVFDAGGNPVPGVPVDFKILQGGGLLGQEVETAITTNSDGKATALLSLGLNEGVNNNVVAAGFGGDPALLGGSQRVTFQASGIVPGNPTDTRVSGVVLDNADVPIPNATATIVGTQLQARTDAQGRFSIAGAPVGTVMLIVDGATTTRAETFPFLAFVLNTIAGSDNTLGMPIYIPPLDTVGSRVVGGDEEVVLTMEGVPGVAFTVAPHSTTTSDGLHQPVKMMLSQVHADKVPMPPPNGSAPRLVWTLQPASVHFDPPIRVQLPNSDGLAPGQVVEIYQFDHDLEQFVSTGPGRVSPDGSVIVSDSGFGITKSGWGAPQPPPPPQNCTASCNDSNVCTADSLQDPPCACSNVPANDGAACGGNQPGANSCLEASTCSGGICFGDFKPDGSSCDDGIFCTETDTCNATGGCKSNPIPPKQGPNVTFELKLDELKDALENVVKKFGLLEQADFTFSTEGNEKDVCCEQKQQKDVPIKTVKYSGNIKLETPKLFVPALSFNIGVVQIGVFAKFGLGASIFLQGENDLCQDNGVCWGGGIQVTGSVEVGLAAQDAAKVVSMSASCQSGLQFDANVTCKEYTIGLSTQPVKCKINIELFDGFVSVGLEKELLPSYPLLATTKPLPTF